MLLLVDSDSTHSFVKQAFVNRAQCQVEPIPAVLVKIANGEIMHCSSRVPNLTWWIQGVTFHTDMHVLDLGAYDVILGIDWLEQFSPMDCHWVDKTMTFEYEGRRVCLQGVRPCQLNQLSKISIDQLQKWYKWNDVWAFTIVKPQPMTVPDDSSEQLTVQNS